jgi:arabinogalactan endo-1,4-beta-galactosidase
MKKLKKLILVSAVVLGLTAGNASLVKADDFINGADISILDEMENSGAVYKSNGTQKDPLTILKDNGVNYVRLRLWVDPYDANGNPYGAGTNDLNRTLKLAKRAKNKGLKVLLDFHYSDFWVDPGKQNLPKAWQNQSFEQLNSSVYSYTADVLNQMKAKGIYPDMVQIGNELNSGMLWPYGKSWGGDGKEFTRLATFLKSGVQAVKDTQSSNTPIMLHLADGGNQSTFQWWLDEITNQSVDFDIVGISYYPYWHGSLADLSANMDNISERYNKKVVVVETAYANTLDNLDQKTNAFTATEEAAGGYKASQDGQYEFLTDLVDKIKDVKNNNGLGFFYWEPLWYNGNVSWATQAGMSYLGVSDMTGNEWENQAVFDFQGNALRGIKAFNYSNLTNLLQNNSFEWDGYTESPSSWKIWKNGQSSAIKTESYDNTRYKLSFWSDKAYESSIYQTVGKLSSGTYKLSIDAMGDTSLETAELYIKNYGGNEQKISLKDSSTWKTYTIDNIQITNGQCEVGVYVKSSANKWLNIDNVRLVKVD